jgi:DNA-binding beta-propeller fold protein YncE
MVFNIAAFAGTGAFGASGDGGSATAATLKEPRGVAVDGAGNVYIADSEAHAIRRVNAQGTISLFAGTGAKGFAGDGGAAAAARFNNPNGLAVDVARNLLYVADTDNHRIRRIDLASGNITTFAGTGVAGLGSDGSTASATLNYPTGVAVDGAGSVYVADTGNNRVVKIANNALATLAGNGQVGSSGDGAAPAQAKLNQPTGVAVTSDGGMVFVADRGNNRVRKITANTITSFAGNGTAASSGDGGQATAAALNAPTDVLVDGSGNVFITDTDGERIRKVNASDGVISTVAGNGAPGNTGDEGLATSATLNTPTAIARNASSGVIYFCDTGNLRARRLLMAGPVNRSPVPDAVGNVILSKSQSVNVALSASDADGDPVTFTLVPALGFVTITNANPAARTATLSINPAGSNAGIYPVRVQAADNKGGTGLTPEFTITVTDPNNNPPTAVMAALPATIFAPAGSATATVNLNGTGSSDPDGDPITYAWFDGATQIASGQVTTAQLAPGAHAIRLVVTDNKGASGSTAIQNVTVQAVTQGNRAPIAQIRNLLTEVVSSNGVDAPLDLDGTDSSDPDNDPLTYEWFDGETRIATGATARVTLPIGEHQIKLRVTDSRDASNETAPQSVLIMAAPAEMEITSVSPNLGRRGATVTMTVNGRGFMPSSYVTINRGGVTVTTTFISSTRLTARLVIADVALTGPRAVTVTNPSGVSSTLSNAFSILQ